MEAKDFVDELVARARKAQEEYEKFSQEQADAIVRACAKAVYDNAEYLARLAVDETRMGVYEHKIQKNKGKAKVIWNSLKGKKSVASSAATRRPESPRSRARSESSAPSHPAPTRSLPRCATQCSLSRVSTPSSSDRIRVPRTPLTRLYGL